MRVRCAGLKGTELSGSLWEAFAPPDTEGAVDCTDPQAEMASSEPSANGFDAVLKRGNSAFPVHFRCAAVAGVDESGGLPCGCSLVPSLVPCWLPCCVRILPKRAAPAVLKRGNCALPSVVPLRCPSCLHACSDGVGLCQATAIPCAEEPTASGGLSCSVPAWGLAWRLAGCAGCLHAGTPWAALKQGQSSAGCLNPADSSLGATTAAPEDSSGRLTVPAGAAPYPLVIEPCWTLPCAGPRRHRPLSWPTAPSVRVAAACCSPSAWTLRHPPHPPRRALRPACPVRACILRQHAQHGQWPFTASLDAATPHDRPCALHAPAAHAGPARAACPPPPSRSTAPSMRVAAACWSLGAATSKSCALHVLCCAERALHAHPAHAGPARAACLLRLTLCPVCPCC